MNDKFQGIIDFINLLIARDLRNAKDSSYYMSVAPKLRQYLDIFVNAQQDQQNPLRWHVSQCPNSVIRKELA